MTRLTFSLPAALDAEAWLPPAHAAWRPLVHDALTFFVRQLPQFRRREIAAEQMRLPAGTPAPVRLVALLKQCPTLHKLGQVLARDERLTPELRAQLRPLESLPAATDVSRLMPAIDRAIGDTRGITIARRALAEASVAVVVPFTWRTAPRRDPVHGVMKVLKPGIRDRLGQELSAWSGLGAFIESRSDFYGLPALDYRDLIDGVAGRLRHEVALSNEQAHIREAARLYENVPGVRVPALFPFCTGEVTAMSRIDGIKLSEVPAGSRRRAVQGMVDALIARPLLSRDSSAPFHADPHPGNLVRTQDGALAILDWSLVARLNQDERCALVQILLGALAFHEAGVCRGLEKLAAGRLPGDALGRICADAVRQLRWGARPGLYWITALLDRAVTEARMRISNDLVLFRKALHTLTGIAGELSTPRAVDAALLASALGQYLGDSAGAAVNPAGAGSAAAGAANAALIGLWCEAPAAAARFWIGAWRDVMAAARA
jgi:ubiquinone biosynthesis protein